MSRRLPRRLLLIGVVVVIFASGLIAYLTFGQSFVQPAGCGCGAPEGDWVYLQRMAHGTQGVFTVEDAQIMGTDLRLFYAFSSPQHSVPTVTVTSSTTKTPLPAQVQSLKQVGDINVGVVHTIHPDHMGQTLSLAITSSATQQPAIRFTVLKQRHSERDSGNNRFTVMVSGDGTDEQGRIFYHDVHQPVNFDSFWRAGNTKAGYFLIRATSTMLYFRADASVALISKQEYDYDTQHNS